VRSKDSLRRVLEVAGEVDVMVNNAARTISRPFWEIEQEEWDDVLAVNLRGVFFGCQLAGERMRERGRGRIINLSSLAGQQGGAVAGAHYAASKAGIIVLTKIVAQELAPHGVTVNAIAPAAVHTPVMDEIAPDRLEALRQRIPVGRFGEAEEVGALAVFLASDAAAYITGATLDMNGGLLMR
jgi:3-oxoacyl-[acyl-carrier protein] reductase